MRCYYCCGRCRRCCCCRRRCQFLGCCCPCCRFICLNNKFNCQRNVSYVNRYFLIAKSWWKFRCTNVRSSHRKRLRLAHSCILARVLLHTGACVNAALLNYLLTQKEKSRVIFWNINVNKIILGIRGQFVPRTKMLDFMNEIHANQRSKVRLASA